MKIRKNFRIASDMKVSDLIMNNAFWLGVWPGIDKQRLDYMKKVINKFLKLVIKK